MGGPPPGKELSVPMAVVAIVNGMIGVAILVLPQTALKGGWLSAIFIILIAALFCYYSCYIGLVHLGDQGDLDTALLRHFNGSKAIKRFYDFVVCCSVFFIVSLFFDLIVTQCQGLIFAKDNVANPIVNSIILLVWCVVLKYYDFGAHIMAYGILSIVGYLLFLLWTAVSAPDGNNKIPVFGGEVIQFLTLMQYGVAIQTYVLPVLTAHKNRRNHAKILALGFIVGASAYYYAAFVGSYGIANREKVNEKGETIEAFFSGEWEVKVLKAIYVIHLYSVFPEYIFVCKLRFFGLIGISITLFKEIVFVTIVVTICTIINISKLDIQVIIDLNGAVLCFCFIYLIPTILHVKCMYFARGKRKVPEEVLEEHQHQELVEEKPDLGVYNKEIIEKQAYEIEMKSQKNTQDDRASPIEGPEKFQGGEKGRSLQSQSQEEQVDYSYFCCNYQRPSRRKQIIQLTVLGVMGVTGLVILVNGVIDAVSKAKSS